MPWWNICQHVNNHFRLSRLPAPCQNITLLLLFVIFYFYFLWKSGMWGYRRPNMSKCHRSMTLKNYFALVSQTPTSVYQFCLFLKRNIAIPWSFHIVASQHKIVNICWDTLYLLHILPRKSWKQLLFPFLLVSHLFTIACETKKKKKKDNRWKDVKERPANCVLKLQPTGEKAVILWERLVLHAGSPLFDRSERRGPFGRLQTPACCLMLDQNTGVFSLPCSSSSRDAFNVYFIILSALSGSAAAAADWALARLPFENSAAHMLMRQARNSIKFGKSSGIIIIFFFKLAFGRHQSRL